MIAISHAIERNARRLPRRAALFLRILAAVMMGYALAYLAAGAAALLLPFPRPEAVLWASMASFLVYAGVAIYAFAARTWLRLWRNLLLLTGLLLAVTQWVPA